MQSHSYCSASLSAAAEQFVQIYFKRWQLACEASRSEFYNMGSDILLDFQEYV